MKVRAEEVAKMKSIREKKKRAVFDVRMGGIAETVA